MTETKNRTRNPFMRLLSAVTALGSAVCMLPAMPNLSAAAADAGQSYNLWVAGQQVTSSNADDILSNHIFSYDAESKTLTVKGDYKVTTYNNFIENSIDGLTIYVAWDSTITPYSTEYYRANGICSAWDMTITGPGKLSILADDYAFPLRIEDYAALTVKDAKLDLKGYTCLNGAYTCSMNVINSEIHAVGKESAVDHFSAGITMDNSAIVSPSGAYISNGGIFNADGSTAKEVTIEPERNEPELWIARTRVTYENAADVLGNGKFSYDPGTNTLTLNGDYTYNGDTRLIDNYINGLTVNVASDTTLTSPNFGAIESDGYDMTITGNGKLTICSIMGIFVPVATLTIKDTNLDIQSNGFGIAGDYGRDKLIVINSTVHIDAPWGAIRDFENGIELQDCFIAEPAGALNQHGSICNADGDEATVVDIVPNQKYDLRVAGTQVYTENQNDILRNGTASYDPETNTLTLNGGVINDISHNTCIHNNIQNLTINVASDTVLNETVSGVAVFSTEDLNITGNGKLTIHASDSAIYTPAATLTVRDANIDIQNCNMGIVGIPGNDKLVVINSTIHAESAHGAIFDFANGIELQNCHITVPEGAFIQNGKICNADGTGATVVDIIPDVTLAITQQPANASGCIGDKVQFTVAAAGEGLKYQWQYYNASAKKWENSGLTGNKTATLTVGVTAARNGMKYHCVVKNAAGDKLISKAATLTVLPKIVTQPENASGCIGDKVQFTVEATGIDLVYQWQYYNKSDKKWENTGLTGNQTPTLTVGVTAGRNNMKYHCIVKDSAGNKVTSGAAVLTVRTSTWFESDTGTLHLMGNIQNGGNDSGIVLPSGVFKNDVKHIVCEKGSVFPADCSSLFYALNNMETCDFTNADTSKMTNCYRFFAVCNSLTTLNFSSFDTGNVTNMASMFYDCTSLETLDLSSFDTDNTENMSCMFYGCSRLKTLDLSSFDTGGVYHMAWMFRDNKILKTIYVSGKWSMKKAWNSDCMFTNCEMLVGGKGTVYNSAKTGHEYACIDGGTDCPGYLTGKGIVKHPKNAGGVVGDTVKFTVETAMQGTVSYQWQYYNPNTKQWENTGLTGNKTETLSVSVIASRNGFQYRCIVTDTYNGTQKTYTSDPAALTVMTSTWFDAESATLHLMGNVENDTNENGSYNGMILPDGIDSDDIQHVVCEKGTIFPVDCGYLFRCFSNMTTCDFTNADTSQMTNCEGMFFYNRELTQINFKDFDTRNVTNMIKMFYYCENLSEINLSSFNTGNVASMYSMFAICSNLKTIDLSSFDTRSVTSMRYMFEWCENLETLNLSSFDTSNVTDMGGLFDHCSSLKTLDLSSFDTRNVKDMDYMFYGCGELTTVYVGGNWSTEKVTDSTDMFTGCGKLVGGKGTVYNSEKIDKEYARIDGGAANPGYLSSLLSITQQPENASGCIGDTVKFTVKASGSGLKYQWQYYNTSTKKWENTGLTGNQTPTLTVTVTAGRNNMKYHCIVKDTNGTKLTSTAATLKVNPKIVTQPVDASGCIGDKVQFTVEATGVGLIYQWQYYNTETKKWENTGLTGNKTPTLTVSVLANRNGMKYHCIMKDTNGTKLTSSAAALKVNPKIVTQPVDASGCISDKVTFTVEATGIGLVYQWQYYNTSTKKWENTGLTGNQTPTLTVSVTAGRNNMKYHCIVKDSAGTKLTSTAATLKVLPKIVTQPKSVTATSGSTAKFTVEATGIGLTYQWQYYNTSTKKWENTGLTGNTTATLSVTAISSRNGMKYHCVIKDSAGNKLTSTAATLTVK